MNYIGIDLGTSACKLLLVDEVGAIVNEVTHEYPLIFPHPGWSEQKPEYWWSAVVTGIPELLRVCLRRALMVWSRAETSAMPVTSKILAILPLFYQNFYKSQDINFLKEKDDV